MASGESARQSSESRRHACCGSFLVSGILSDEIQRMAGRGKKLDRFTLARAMGELSLNSLPSYIDPELWSAFMETRKAMKVPFTQAAQKLVIRRLMKMHAEGWDVNSSLEKSTIYGYRGVFEVERIDKTPARDPTLVKLEQDAKKATPIPESVRVKLDFLVDHLRM